MESETKLRHPTKAHFREANPNWKGGAQQAICAQCGASFFAARWELKHRRFCSKKCVGQYLTKPPIRKCRKHIQIVEAILKCQLPTNAVIHHGNLNSEDNAPGNLVLCPNQAYHILLHYRQRIVDAGGNPKTDKICGRCKQLKPKSDFHKSKRNDGYRCYCKACQHIVYNERRQRFEQRLNAIA